jgi:hypothetical protein
LQYGHIDWSLHSSEALEVLIEEIQSDCEYLSGDAQLRGGRSDETLTRLLLTHATLVNKQLNDKERVAAALENGHLLDVVNSCIAQH